jgi:hypothetical protein
MKLVPLVVLITIGISAASPVVLAQTAAESEAVREQVKADRLKAKAEDDNSPKQRFWDRDADGKRPWERPLPKG